MNTNQSTVTTWITASYWKCNAFPLQLQSAAKLTSRSPTNCDIAHSTFLYFLHHLQLHSSAGSPGWYAAFSLKQGGYGSSGSIGCLIIRSSPQSCGAHQPEQLLESWTGWNGAGITPLLAHARRPSAYCWSHDCINWQDPALWSHCSWATLIHGFCWHIKGRGLVHPMSYSRWLSQKYHRWKK